jgi:hypothetical protein
MVEEIAASLPGPCIETEMIASGGASLGSHWSSDSVAQRIRTGPWTHVVLNDQSTFAEAWVIDGHSRVGGDAQELAEFGRRFAGVIRTAGAKPILLAHWSDEDAPARDQAALDYAFATLSRATRAVIAPAGAAIKQLQNTLPAVSPYFDGHHLSPTGAYLEALIVYSTLTDRSPMGAATHISGPAVDFNLGIVFPDSIVTLADIPDSLAPRLQRLAAAHASYRRSIMNVSRPAPLTAEYPKVPGNGDVITRESLAGRWRGTTTVLSGPSGRPVTLEISIHASENATDSARIELMPDSVRVRMDSVRTRVPPRAFAGVAEVRIQNRALVVRAPVGPQNSIVEFRGALVSGVLSGVAELHVPGRGGTAFHSVGRFELAVKR